MRIYAPGARGYGRRSSGAALGILFPDDGTEWGTLLDGLSMGLGAPTYSWKFDLASGTPVDDIAAAELPPVGAPGYEVASTQWPGNVGMSFAVDGNSRLQAGSALWDASGSFAIMLPMEFGVTLPAALVTLLRGRNGTSGWDLNQQTDGTLIFTMDDQTTTQVLTTTGGSHAGEAHLIHLGRDVTAGRAWLCTGRAQIDVALTATGNLDSTEVSGVGRFSTANIACGVQLAYWAGAAAEGGRAADWTKYATHLGVE